MSAPPAERPWYANGLRFACRPDCGRCCTRHGEYDYVYLEREDVARLSAHFAMSPNAFRQRYTKKDEGHTVLKMDGPACPFLEGFRCSVYDARPKQCRTFPFWPENLGAARDGRRCHPSAHGVGEGRRFRSS